MPHDVQLGIKHNRLQFILLVIINALVGAMLGLERSILPQFAEEKFHISSKSIIMSFIIGFGISKAMSNYISGRLANNLGRKKLLVGGWLVALPIPFIFIFSDNWVSIIIANLLLGINQGLAWSMTVTMKIDLVKSEQRGFAIGINEFAGYLSIGLVSWLSSAIAARYGIEPYPFYLGILFSVAGLVLSLFFVHETQSHAQKHKEIAENTTIQVYKKYFTYKSNKNSVVAITFAGFVNNLNDGMIWGLLPILLFQQQFGIKDIGVIVSIYPGIWGISQLYTGHLSDIFSKKNLIVLGMGLQSIAIFLFLFATTFIQFCMISILLGIGTALVYPTFINALTDYLPVGQRAEGIGVFRFWRDLGYAFGAFLTGFFADLFGISSSIIFVASVTLLSAVIVKKRVTPYA